MNFGSKLRDLRKKNNLSQTDLSKLTNIPQTTISDWERGRCLPDIKQAQIIAEAFGLSIKDLISA